MSKVREGALLAGVCAATARAFGWNVWVLRAICVLFLLIKTLWAIVAYAALAALLYLFDGDWRPGRGARDGLESPELAARNRRISELERRFEELQRGG